MILTKVVIERKTSMKKSWGIVLLAALVLMGIAVVVLQKTDTGKGLLSTSTALSEDREGNREEQIESKCIRIGATPGEDIAKITSQYEVFLKFLEKKLGYKVELFTATDYASVIEAMRSKKIDVAMFGPLSYVLASSIADAEAFASDYRKNTGSFYKAYVIVHPDSGIENLTQLKGKKFAFVDPASTGGYMIPKLEMLNMGIDPDKDFASVIFAGGHDACALAVKNRSVDGATIVAFMYDKIMEEGLISEKDAKRIKKKKKFPGSAWAYRRSLDDKTKREIKSIMLGLTDEEKEELREFLGSTIKWAEVKDSDYDSLREAAKKLNIDLEAQ